VTTRPDAYGCPLCYHTEIPAGPYVVQHDAALQRMYDHLRDDHLLGAARIHTELTRLRPIRLEEVAS
jgi:hypothetical protein